MKLKEQHSITRVDNQLMQSLEGCLAHILQTLYELELRRRYHKHKVMCHCYESFLFLAQKKTKEKTVVQGIIFSVLGSISPPARRIPDCHTTRRYGFPATANIRCIKECAGILRTTKKLSTKQPVKIRALMVQPETTGDLTFTIF